MQSIYTSQVRLSLTTVPDRSEQCSRRAKLIKTLTNRLDLFVVVTLLSTCGAYCAYALLHIA